MLCAVQTARLRLTSLSYSYSFSASPHHHLFLIILICYCLIPGELDPEADTGKGKGRGKKKGIGKGEGEGDRTEERLLDLCWSRLSAALPHGISGLRSRHEAFFSERMARTDISLSSVNATQTCSGGSVGDRLKSFGAGCKRDNQEEKDRDRDKDRGAWSNGVLAGVGAGLLAAAGISSETADRSTSVDDLNGGGIEIGDTGGAAFSLEQVVDVKLVSQAFMYGRYLLFSSATQSPLNLQGIWTDGPSASWNGSYQPSHMHTHYCTALHCTAL